MFLLKILWSLFELEKCLSIKDKNLFATFVDTSLLKGGLNHTMLRLLFFRSGVVGLWNVSVTSLYHPIRYASAYSCLLSRNTSWLDEFLDSRSLIDFGSCVSISLGWLKDVLMYSISLFGLWSIDVVVQV